MVRSWFTHVLRCSEEMVRRADGLGGRSRQKKKFGLADQQSRAEKGMARTWVANMGRL